MVTSSPVDCIRPSRERSRERVLEPAELTEVWSASDALSYPFGPFFRLLILTAQRRGEVAAMRCLYSAVKIRRLGLAATSGLGYRTNL